jgi:FecR protein
MSINLTGVTGLLGGLFLLSVSSGYAQNANICQSAEMGDPPRVVYDCANGLVIEVEASADFQLQLSPDQTSLQSIGLKDDAVLIELRPGSGPFQILTPHAIASVRGTIYAVDVQEALTSVFVVRGVVSVTRADGSDAVELAAGDGVVVSAGEPLTVKQWPQEKVSKLLARFGR